MLQQTAPNRTGLHKLLLCSAGVGQPIHCRSAVGEFPAGIVRGAAFSRSFDSRAWSRLVRVTALAPLALDATFQDCMNWLTIPAAACTGVIQVCKFVTLDFCAGELYWSQALYLERSIERVAGIWLSPSGQWQWGAPMEQFTSTPTTCSCLPWPTLLLMLCLLACGSKAGRAKHEYLAELSELVGSSNTEQTKDLCCMSKPTHAQER